MMLLAVAMKACQRMFKLTLQPCCRAEELRRKAAAGEEGAGHAGISGTAAAFAEGADAEPHQVW